MAASNREPTRDIVIRIDERTRGIKDSVKDIGRRVTDTEADIVELRRKSDLATGEKLGISKTRAVAMSIISGIVSAAVALAGIIWSKQ